jgi:regulator of RNase E activity RraA
VRVCGAELQPEGALSLLEPVERLAGDPVVAAPLQVPAPRFGAERSVISFGEPVNVYDMIVKHGDVVHADEHGAVTFPAELTDEIAVKAAEFVAREMSIIASCKKDELTLDELRHLYLARK